MNDRSTCTHPLSICVWMSLCLHECLSSCDQTFPRLCLQSPLAAKFSMPFPTQFMLAGCSARRPGSPRSLKNRKDSEKLIESRRKTSLCSCAAGAAGHALINSSGRASKYFTLIFSDRGSCLERGREEMIASNAASCVSH